MSEPIEPATTESSEECSNLPKLTAEEWAYVQSLGGDD